MRWRTLLSAWRRGCSITTSVATSSSRASSTARRRGSRAAISSARLYWETAQVSTSGFFDPRNVQLPVAVTVFPDEIYAAPKSWAERAYPKLLYYNKVAKGGHFAAWEQPEAFVVEQRNAFRTLR